MHSSLHAEHSTVGGIVSLLVAVETLNVLEVSFWLLQVLACVHLKVNPKNVWQPLSKSAHSQVSTAHLYVRMVTHGGFTLFTNSEDYSHKVHFKSPI